MKTFTLVVSLFAIMAFTATAKKKINVWLIGDSTMSVKEKKAYPETGWGMPFVNFWDSTVTILNKAKNGRSTQSFMDEGIWKEVTDDLQEDDYVFIQFGHNDEVPTKKTYTTPDQFRGNLVKYIAETKAKKGIPVLLTPVARRKFDSTGTIQETHAAYSAIVREVAKEQNVILIDLDKLSMKYYQQLGSETSKLLFNHLSPGEHPNYPEGKQDDTHFSELGARKIAEIVLAEIKSQHLELAERIVTVPVKK